MSSSRNKPTPPSVESILTVYRAYQRAGYDAADIGLYIRRAIRKNVYSANAGASGQWASYFTAHGRSERAVTSRYETYWSGRVDSALSARRGRGGSDRLADVPLFTPRNYGEELGLLRYLRSKYGTQIGEMGCGHPEYASVAIAVVDPNTGHGRGYFCRKCIKGFVLVSSVAYDPKEIAADTPVESVTLVTGYKQTRVIDKAPPYLARDAWEDKDGKKNIGTMNMAAYHSSRERGYAELGHDETKPTFGCEIEINVRQNRDLHYRQLERQVTKIILAHGDKLDVERDGSVPNGCEIVTGFGGYTQVAQLLRNLYTETINAESLVFATSRTTGLHIHMGLPPEAGRIKPVRAAGAIGLLARYPALNLALAGRPPNRYCAMPPAYLGGVALEKIRVALRNEDDMFRNRYSAINTQRLFAGHASLEWRSARSTVKLSQALARLQFARLMAEVSFDPNLVEVPSVQELADRIMAWPVEESAALRHELAAGVIKVALARYRTSGEDTRAADYTPLVSLPFHGRREMQYCR